MPGKLRARKGRQHTNTMLPYISIILKLNGLFFDVSDFFFDFVIITIRSSLNIKKRPIMEQITKIAIKSLFSNPPVRSPKSEYKTENMAPSKPEAILTDFDISPRIAPLFCKRI